MVLALTGLALVLPACGPDSPIAGDRVTAITGPTAPAESYLISVCHRESNGRFTPILVATSAAAEHFAHGDGQVGRLVPGQGEAKFGPDCSAIPLVPATITFSSLSGNASPFAAIVESGFTISPRSGAWEALTTYGHPAPCVVFRRLPSSSDVAAEIEVRADGELFTFRAVELYSSITKIPYVITGRIDAVEVLSLSGTVPNTFGYFATVVNPNAPALMDTLVIRVVNPATPCCSNPAGLDNISLKR